MAGRSRESEKIHWANRLEQRCVSCLDCVGVCVMVYMCVAAQCSCSVVFFPVVVVYKRRGHQREGVRVYNL